MANTVCNVPGCPEVTDRGRCEQHRKRAEKARRPDGNPYNDPGHLKRFRPGVLAKNPVCVLCHRTHSTVADHWPKTRKELEELKLDPNDPRYGRGLCKPCHDASTAEHQPGGWNARE